MVTLPGSRVPLPWDEKRRPQQNRQDDPDTFASSITMHAMAAANFEPIPGGPSRGRVSGIANTPCPSQRHQFPMPSTNLLSSQMYFGHSVTFGCHRQEGMGNRCPNLGPDPSSSPIQTRNRPSFIASSKRRLDAVSIPISMLYTSIFGRHRRNCPGTAWQKL